MIKEKVKGENTDWSSRIKNSVSWYEVLKECWKGTADKGDSKRVGCRCYW